MEEMMKLHTNESDATASELTMHKDSHVISKTKSKIRIIHIYAPEIIKTDVSNFRELVQRLTGKPTDQKGRKKKAKSVTGGGEEELRISSIKPTNKTTELELAGDGFQSLEYGERITEEEERMWGIENSSELFGGMEDLDGFIRGLSHCPLLPLNSPNMDVFPETHLSK